MWVVCVRERGKPLVNNKTGKNGTDLVKSHPESQMTLFNQQSCTEISFSRSAVIDFL